jgi:hypothetical protein
MNGPTKAQSSTFAIIDEKLRLRKALQDIANR